ncbi:unnamed protein product [Didymodactylos carnosus]|uniref:Trichohyalin-plectin-homology domain-containing protein n=1 Tax=Didymodactylos carnosus TaxID=1234261 RepID=A0A815JZH9_9BILA|nr:unnamed protein product [Didymodactylos carnosus]CAF1386024.1 unnamed protein product [Didymodactylos carnosus]CAF4002581.1 unnamed protein product [Didymodactylos carnosus]CAF4281011.1 unnamed protein product [Didymodactylos carnosus]
MATGAYYPPLRIRDIPGPQPGQFGLLERPYRPHKNIVMQNREIENTRLAFDRQNRAAKLELNKIEFDELSSGKAFYAEVRREVQRRLNHSNHQLEERRERLRGLLSSEEAQYLQEGAESKETLAQRISKMRQKAKQIREQKENDHQRIVQEKLDQRFRRDCAELRELQSKDLNYELGNEHLWQMKEKIDKQQERKKEDEFFTQLWYNDIAAKKSREERDAEQARLRSQNMSHIIQQQMQAADSEKNELKSKRKEHSEAAKEEKVNEYQEKLRKQDELRKSLDTVLRTKQNIQQRKTQEELALEQKLLEETQNVTKSDEDQKLKRMVELREEGKRYREYLDQRQQDEKRKEFELEKVLHQELEKQHAKRVETIRAERSKRETLLQQVIVGRQQQLEERMRRKEDAKQEFNWEKENMKNVVEQAKQEEAERLTKNKMKQMTYRQNLLGQLDYEKRRQEEELYENQCEYMEGMKTEEDYQRKLTHELENAGISHQHPVRKWYSAKMGNTYKSEKPPMDDYFRTKDDLFCPSQPVKLNLPTKLLPVPIVYH